MPNTELAASTYKKLVSDIVSLFEGVRRSLAEAYWKTGQWIVEVEQGGEAKAGHGKELLPRLSRELTQKLGAGFSVESLRRMRLFYLNNPKSSPARILTWAHHVELLSVHDKKKRLELEKQAEQGGLDRDGLRKLIRQDAVRAKVAKNLETPPENRAPVDLLPVPKPGRLNAYLIKASNDTAWPVKNVLLLDHGFKGYRELTPRESYTLKAGEVVEWTGAKLLKGSRTTKDLYTYRAYLESWIDGDTLWVVLDTGMREMSRQKLRLRGIDCPELNTQEGQAAKKFAQALLKDVPSLTVLSSRNASYDRYEADIFYVDTQGKEQYLNNVLLESGYAVRVKA
jgi:hypothetical protein